MRARAPRTTPSRADPAFVSELATIEFRRPRGGNARLRGFRLFVDDELAGVLKSDDRLNVSISPGRHIVRAVLAKESSQDLELHLEPGEVVTVECSAPGNPYVAVVRWFTRRDDWLKLRVVDSVS
jgi:hypothetical protein